MTPHYKDLFRGLRYLEADADGRPADKRLRVCVAAILWEMAKADQRIAPEEVVKIVFQLDHEFGLHDSEAMELIDIADFLNRERERVTSFIEEVRSRFDPEQREYLVQLLEEVAHADRYLHPVETKFSDYVRERLGLTGKMD